MDVATILRAADLVSDFAPAVRAIYEGFIAEAEGETQAELKRQYEVAIALSDDLHREVQSRLAG